MKCVRIIKTGVVYRVSDEIGKVVVKEMREAVYVPKKIWRKSARHYADDLFNVKQQKG